MFLIVTKQYLCALLGQLVLKSDGDMMMVLVMIVMMVMLVLMMEVISSALRDWLGVDEPGDGWWKVESSIWSL